MADGRHIENGLLAISQREILQDKAESRSNTGHMTKNNFFRKFKMAERSHFENSFIAISQPEIIRFQRNLVRCRLCFQGRLLNKLLKFCQVKMADGRHIGNRLLAISQRLIIRLMRNFVR